MNSVIRIYKVAILENGIGIEMESENEHLGIGDTVETQWGPRKVVSISSHRDVLEHPLPNGC